MSWKLRHEGSPLAIEGLNASQVVEGLQDGLWEPTDEVREDGESQWQAIENHPKFAEIAAEIEPPPPKEYPDETRLDMNPLIDVALVLLIFFILTTSYAAIQKVLDMPPATTRNPKGVPVVTQERIKKFTIKVQARMKDGKPVITVEDEEVDPKYLLAALSRYVRDTHRTEMVLDAAGVDWGTVVAIEDAAKGAGVQQAHLLIPRESSKK
jgi:biopolymer transport protein ExbD